jgi:nitric oxide reductase subunit C
MVTPLLLLAMAGCERGTDAPTPPPSVSRPSEEELRALEAESPELAAGARVFYADQVGTLPGCVACHERAGQSRVGPPLAGLSARAGQTVPGLDAEAYVRQSVVDPAAHLVPGYANLMPPSYGEVLSDEDLDVLVAFLLSDRAL